jgi:hypothetical protein
VDVSEGVMRQFRIETGERRYWATWLLRDFVPGYNGDGMIPCIIIPVESYSPFRQAKENTARTGLSAIAMARQAALLLLAVHGYPLPVMAVDNDFYRQALELDLKSKREFTGEILTAMGGISRMRLSQFKALLNLSDEAIELADRYDIDEKKLRYVIALPHEYHVEVIRQIIDLNLTSKQVKEICEVGGMSDNESGKENETDDRLPRQAIQLARLARESSKASSADIARALMAQEQNPHIARAHIQTLQRVLDEAEKYLLEQ